MKQSINITHNLIEESLKLLEKHNYKIENNFSNINCNILLLEYKINNKNV